MENFVATPMMKIGDAVKVCFSKYANFNGRARRSEFWWFYLCVSIVNWILGGILQYCAAAKSALVNEAMSAAFSGGDVSAIAAQESTYATINLVLMIIMAVWSLATLIPTLAAMARRLHDTGKSANLLWCFLICGIGGLIPLIMCIPDGQPEANQYGESPKYIRQ